MHTLKEKVLSRVPSHEKKHLWILGISQGGFAMFLCGFLLFLLCFAVDFYFVFVFFICML